MSEQANAEFVSAMKLWQIAEMAMVDLEKAEKTPGLKIDMDTWHEPRNKKCFVCFAGCVMAKRFGLALTAERVPGDFPEPIAARFRALNYLRCGDVKFAAAIFGVTLPDGCPEFTSVRDYSTGGPTQFKADMGNLIATLKQYDV